MTQASTEIQGAARLRSTLAAARSDFTDMDQSESARLIESRAAQRAPKRSGRLASSVRARDLGKGAAEVASSLIYAPVIHYGWPAHSISANPFLETAATDSVPLVQAANLKEADRILGKVHGA